MRKLTRACATLVTAATLAALGLALAPTAMAAVPSSSSSATANSSTRATTDSATAVERGREGDGPRGGRPGLETIMSVLDLTASELKAALKAGMTLAELAEQQNVDVSTLIDALANEAHKHITEHIASGTLTQEKADKRLAKIEQRITSWVNGGKPAEGDRPDRGERGDRPDRGDRGHGPRGPAGDESFTNDGS